MPTKTRTSNDPLKQATLSVARRAKQAALAAAREADGLIREARRRAESVVRRRRLKRRLRKAGHVLKVASQATLVAAIAAGAVAARRRLGRTTRKSRR